MEAQAPAISQRSEEGRGILCAKEGIGKYGMWYGVICKAVMSSCMSAGCSLAGGRDMVPCLAITDASLYHHVVMHFSSSCSFLVDKAS
jgi:hypothetical protein